MSVDRRLIVAAVLVTVVANLLVATREAEETDSEQHHVQAVGQALLDEMRTSMIGATVLAHGDGAWVGRLDLSAAPAIPSASLPRTTTARTFGRESVSGERTGNTLVFASPARRLVMRGADQRTLRIQLHRLVAYYLTVAGEGPRPDAPGGLNLARFVSVRVVDADQIDAIPDREERTRILRQIAGRKGDRSVAWAFRRRGASAGVYRIDPKTGALRSGGPLPADPAHSEVALLPGDQMSVASNYADPSVGVVSFARRSDDRGGFPHGFEVQLSSSSTRQVMVHLTLTTHRQNAPVTADLRGIALARQT